MTKGEFEKLKKVDEVANIIRGCDLKNQKNRTLMYGYNCDNTFFHIYILDGIIHRYVYSMGYTKNPILDRRTEDEIMSSYYASNQYYIPNKRVYPECCDIEFCTILKEDGILIPFTTFGQISEIKDFYGKLL